MSEGARVLTVAAMAALTGLAACAAPLATGADFDPAVGIGSPSTFSWDEPDDLPVGDPRLDNNPFFVGRLHDAIERELGVRGVRHVEEDGDLLVHHHASVQNRVDVIRADEAAGYMGGPYEDVQVYEYEEGTFLVDVADARTKRVLWRGWARTDLMGAVDDLERLGELVDKAVVGMFERFPTPDRTTTPRRVRGQPDLVTGR